MLTPRYLGGEAGHRGLLGGSGDTRGRRAALVVWFLVFCVLTLLFHLTGLLLSLVLLLAVLAGTARRGRESRWRHFQNSRSWRRRVRSGFDSYRPVDRLPDGMELSPLELAKYREWPEGAEGFYWLDMRPGVPGIQWHLPPETAPYLAVTWQVDGAIAGLESDDTVNGASASFGDLLASTARALSLVDGIQSVTQAAQVDVTPHETWVMSNVAEKAPRELLRSYDQLVGMIERVGMTQEHYLVVRWPITAAFLARAELRGPGQVGWLLLMDDEIRRMTRLLSRSHLGQVRPLTAKQVCAVVRHAQLPSWPSGDMDGVDPGQGGTYLLAYDLPEPTHATTEDIGPGGIPERWYHRTAEVPVRRLEAAQVDALWLTPILSGLPEQVHRTVATHIATRPAGAARRSARTDMAMDLAEMREQQRKGFLIDDDLGAGHQAARVRHRDLKPGTGVQGAGWSMHITISAQSVDALRTARDLIEAGCSDAGITGLDWLDGHHGSAMSWTWAIGRGMAALGSSPSDRLLAIVREQAGEDPL